MYISANSKCICSCLKLKNSAFNTKFHTIENSISKATVDHPDNNSLNQNKKIIAVFTIIIINTKYRKQKHLLLTSRCQCK
jgi:hypothetical protein